MLEGINDRENYIKIFIGEKRNIQKICSINPKEYFEKVWLFINFKISN